MTINNRRDVLSVLALFERGDDGATSRADVFQDYIVQLYASSQDAVESPMGIAIGKIHACGQRFVMREPHSSGWVGVFASALSGTARLLTVARELSTRVRTQFAPSVKGAGL